MPVLIGVPGRDRLEHVLTDDTDDRQRHRPVVGSGALCDSRSIPEHVAKEVTGDGKPDLVVHPAQRGTVCLGRCGVTP